jgi:hypothetical protein
MKQSDGAEWLDDSDALSEEGYPERSGFRRLVRLLRRLPNEKRNSCEYDFAGGVSDTDADGLLATVRQFAVDAEAWINARHPNLA